MKWKRIALLALLIWVVLLLLSTVVRLLRGIEPQPQADQTVATIPASSDSAEGESVLLAYREYGQSNQGTPVVLLHGNPMAGRAMRPLGRALGEARHVLSPDLPGLGFSSRNLKAYSAAHHATILFAWLDQRSMQKVDLVAYSQGGPVALEMADRHPERIRSVSFIATVGLQEHELLGDYSLNQPLYTLYTAGLRGLRWLTPHFGLFDDPICHPTTARNFSDTDLRRNRPLLERFSQPALILHSSDDRLVPYAAAKAHADLIPQSYFRHLPGGHMGLLSELDEYSKAVRDFLALVDAGQARIRQASVTNHDEPGFKVDATRSVRFLQAAVIGLLLFLMVFVSEDLACIAGGMLAASGLIPLWEAILACFLGIWVSDVLLYFLGWAVRKGSFQFRFLQRKERAGQMDYYREAYQKNGLKLVFMTRFLPGSRVIAYTTAGFLGLGWFRFSLWLFMAAAVWTPILVSVAYLVGQPLIHWWEMHGLVLLPLLLLAVFALYCLIGVLTKALTYRGRAMLRGRWRRITHWEYWPTFVVYIPVFFYCLGLALRHRSLTLWAACNPGMQPLSGLAMESKSRILGSLNDASGRLPKWCLLEEGDSSQVRFSALKNFMDSNALDWPIVLKPDVGQRGEGVAILRSPQQAEHYLTANHEALIAQEYADGQEYGVFYYRFPGQKGGAIFSVTKKVLSEVEGDGRRNLEQLILDHPRHVAQAQHYLKVNAGRLNAVPNNGTTVRLVELGTHCRGAVFMDGGDEISNALACALDEVLAGYEGFHFGRFDLKVPEGHELRHAKAFKVIELNGVSSESTDVYDPSNSLLHGWRKLCLQWKLAFEIGAANRSKGYQPPAIGELFRVLARHRRRQFFEAADLDSAAS